MSARLPNVLLLALESTPASHLSCYGYQRETTPHLDRFAEESTLYRQAISAASWTLPSHASLFTGLHISQHGVKFDSPFLGGQIVTLAELLRERGYNTAAFTTNDWVNEKFGFNRGFDTFRWAKRTMEWLNPWFPAETKGEKAIRYLRDPVYPIGNRNNRLLKEWIGRVRDTGRPFFAYTLYFDPHYPYRPQYPYARRFLRDAPRPWWRVNLDPDRYMSGAIQMSEDELITLRALYDSRLAGTDAVIGRFLDFLRRSNLLDDTVVIIVADHGENLGDHGLMSHQYCVYDSLIHVPLIIRYPRLFPAGAEVGELVQSLEIFTTILDIVGLDRAEIPNDVRGRSLIPEQVASSPMPFAVSEYLTPNLARMRRLFGQYQVERHNRSLRAVRTSEYKAIFSSDDVHELYHLASDPGETQNLAPDNPAQLAVMRSLLDEWLQSVGAHTEAEHAGVPGDLDDSITQRLRDLGYL